MVVLLLAGLFANWSAPRRLQSLAAPVHAEAAVNAAPAGSSVLSTVIVVFGAFGRTSSSVLVESSTSISLTPLSFLGRGNTATGALSVSKVVLVKPVPAETSSSALSLGAIGCTISSFD